MFWYKLLSSSETLQVTLFTCRGLWTPSLHRWRQGCPECSTSEPVSAPTCTAYHQQLKQSTFKENKGKLSIEAKKLTNKERYRIQGSLPPPKKSKYTVFLPHFVHVGMYKNIGHSTVLEESEEVVPGLLNLGRVRDVLKLEGLSYGGPRNHLYGRFASITTCLTPPLPLLMVYFAPHQKKRP